MKISLGLLFFFFASQLAVVIEAFDSWRSRIFLPSQMMAEYGRPGINFITHGGMWSDMFLLPVLLCVMLTHSGPWSLNRDWLPVLIGILLTAGNQLILSRESRPDPLGSVDLLWSTAIAIHFVYMATYIAIIGHFYFNPVDASPQMIVVVSVLLGVHVAAGTHVFLGMANLFWNWNWCPDLLGNPGLPWMTLVVWVLLAGLACFAGGIPAGVGVAVSGILLSAGVVLFAGAFR